MKTISKRWLVLVALAVVAVGGAGVAASHASSASEPDILVFVAHLDSSQPVAGSNSTANGTATLQIDTVNKTMTTDLQWSGLTEPADRAHVHSGYEGDPAGSWMFHEIVGVDFDLENEVLPGLVYCTGDDPTLGDPPTCAPTAGSIHDVLDITNGYDNCENYDGNPIPDPFQCVVDHAVPDGFFIDMHTGDYPGGEIRGQFLLVPGFAGFVGPVASSQAKAGATVPVKFGLVNHDGNPISDAQALSLLGPLCTLKFSASGVQNVAPTCVKYDATTDKFVYNWKVGKSPGGQATIAITASYPPSTYVATLGSEPITIKAK